MFLEKKLFALSLIIFLGCILWMNVEFFSERGLKKDMKKTIRYGGLPLFLMTIFVIFQ